MSSLFSFLLLVLITIGVEQDVVEGGSRTVRDVTFGSIFKLVNIAYQVRLHSHDVKYGSGSGQQSVTGVEETDDVNSHWLLKGTTVTGSKRGEPIRCGSKIRLEHPPTQKNLHSHLFSSPLSHHQEISAYGIQGEGDTGDVWQVVCKGSSNTWKRDEPVQLRHIDTESYLGVSGNTFGRPISGQYEIIGLAHPDSSTQWETKEGIFIHPSEVNSNSRQSSYKNDEHDEL